MTAARFVGTPPMNVISARHLITHMTALGLQDQLDELRIGIRPEQLTLTENRSDMSFKARVLNCEYEGSETLVRLQTEFADPVTVSLPSARAPDRDASVYVGCQPHDIRIFRVKDGSRLSYENMRD